MNTLRELLQDYLSMRRALGFKLHTQGTGLLSFVSFMEQAQAEYITTDLALAWAQLPTSVQPNRWSQRLCYVRGFARYCSAIDARTEEVPPAGLLPHSHTRPNPYFFTDEDIEGLLQGALPLPAKDGLAIHTYCCLFGLLSVTGLRIGEALGLNVEDVDLDEGILTILSAKCGKSRLAWVIPTTVARSSAPVCPVDDIALVSRRRGCGTTNNGAFSISWPRRSQRYLLVFVGLPTIAGCGQGTA